MLWLALRFPNLSFEALGQEQDHNHTETQACVVEHQHRVHALNKSAIDAGIQTGMKVTAVHALAKTTVLERDLRAEDQALQRLAAWAYSYTPYIQRYSQCHYQQRQPKQHLSEHCLLLEVSRCLRLFGGIENFCQQLTASLNSWPHQYEMGLAHSRQGAWLLSHAQHAICEDDSQQVFISRIADMPLNYLHAFPSVRDDLKAVGLTTFSHLLKLPSHELSKRFGEDFNHWLKELAGEQLEALPLHQPEEPFCASVSFNHPVNDTKLLEVPTEHLLQEFVDYLVKNQQEAQQIDWYFYSPQGQVHSISLGTERIHNQWQLLLDLTRIRLEQLQLYFEIERLELRCDQTAAVVSKTAQLFDQMDVFNDSSPDNPTLSNQDLQESAETMLARLQTRMGNDAVYQLSETRQSLPEKQSARVLPFVTADSNKQSAFVDQASAQRAPRPCWLFQKPKQISQKGNNLFWKGTLQLVQGPERIEGNWWEHRSVRDYFVAQREDQIRYWVYHDWADDSWHAQGIFA